MTSVLARNWWTLALRGVAGVFFALGAFAMPGITLVLLLALFGAYAVVDGLLAIVGSVRAAERHERWWPMLFEGAAGIVTGGFTLAWPLVTIVTLVYLVSLWAVVTGVLKMVAAIRLRRELRGEWIHGTNGAISVLFGLFLVVVPGAAFLAIVWWIAGYALFRGMMLLALAFQLRRHFWTPAHGGPSSR